MKKRSCELRWNADLLVVAGEHGLGRNGCVGVASASEKSEEESDHWSLRNGTGAVTGRKIDYLKYKKIAEMSIGESRSPSKIPDVV